jgi:GT2 family glycosyltransferase
MEDVDPRVAVVMIAYNRRREVLNTLAHLTCLPERPSIVVVDNGSNDGTTGAIMNEFSGVRVVAAGRNLGAAGRTLGGQLTATPYVALCDDDTWWEPGSLRLAADLLDEHARLAVLTGRILVGPQEVEDPICQEMNESPLPAEPEMPGRPLLGFLAGASVVRRSAFLAHGGFQPRFGIGGEEELLALDLAAAGWWLCYVPELVVYHHPSPCRDVCSRRWHLVRNALWSAWLRRPISSCLRKTWRTVRSAPLESGTWKGLAAAIGGLPWVLGQRRVVPAEIECGLRMLEQQQSFHRLPHQASKDLDFALGQIAPSGP